MKIEKINDNQIRCTLTKSDLADRELKISELAYGTEKAKSLFRDMMQQAAYEFGFEAEDIPLMIEAIPLSQDCIILVITKVDDPEELDTRFSKFAPDADEIAGDSNTEVISAGGADDFLDIFKRLHEEKNKTNEDKKSKDSNEFVPLLDAINAAKEYADSHANTGDASKKDEEPAMFKFIKIYSFNDLDTVTRLAHVLSGFYYGENSLYKHPVNGSYLLSISKENHTPEEFNKVCNILSEYGTSLKATTTAESFFNEHADVLIKGDAIQKLALI